MAALLIPSLPMSQSPPNPLLLQILFQQQS